MMIRTPSNGSITPMLQKGSGAIGLLFCSARYSCGGERLHPDIDYRVTLSRLRATCFRRVLGRGAVACLPAD